MHTIIKKMALYKLVFTPNGQDDNVLDVFYETIFFLSLTGNPRP